MREITDEEYEKFEAAYNFCMEGRFEIANYGIIILEHAARSSITLIYDIEEDINYHPASNWAINTLYYLTIERVK